MSTGCIASDTCPLVVWWCYGILLKLFIHVVCWVYVLCEKFARFTFYEGRGIPGSLTNQNAAKWFTLVHSQSQIRNVGWSWFIPQRSSYDCSRYPCCFYVVRPYCVWLFFVWNIIREKYGYSLTKLRGKNLLSRGISWAQVKRPLSTVDFGTVANIFGTYRYWRFTLDR